MMPWAWFDRPVCQERGARLCAGTRWSTPRTTAAGMRRALNIVRPAAEDGYRLVFRSAGAGRQDRRRNPQRAARRWRPACGRRPGHLPEFLSVDGARREGRRGGNGNRVEHGRVARLSGSSPSSGGETLWTYLLGAVGACTARRPTPSPYYGYRVPASVRDTTGARSGASAGCGEA